MRGEDGGLGCGVRMAWWGVWMYGCMYVRCMGVRDVCYGVLWQTNGLTDYVWTEKRRRRRRARESTKANDTYHKRVEYDGQTDTKEKRLASARAREERRTSRRRRGKGGTTQA
ncbi:hypothetical protein BV20DRAFT_703320 [Pilatotrama ljubarskyi]|nr:hypothetical protein BV20DRAFT_703320 [Pilatotrama ljubarskyi]